MLISQRPQLRPIPREWEPDLLSFELFLKVEERTLATVDTCICHLRTLPRQYGVGNLESVTSDNLVWWSGSKNWVPETRNSYHALIRVFFQWRSQYYVAKILPYF